MGSRDNGDDPLWAYRGGARVNVTEGLFAIADALHRLGTGDASTNFGAIEALAMMINKSLKEHGSAIAEGLREAAQAINDKSFAAADLDGEGDIDRP
jgi:hypothetical protein